MNYEVDLLDQAKVLQDGGPDAFKPTLKISYENFKLKGQVKAMEQQLHQARADADMIRKYDDETIAAGKEKLTRGELVIMNRKLNDNVQRLIRTPQQGQDFELYKNAAYVLTSEYARYKTPLPEFFEEAHDLLCKVWEEPLPQDHPYARKLYAKGPKNQNRFPAEATSTSPHFHKDHLKQFQHRYTERHPWATPVRPLVQKKSERIRV